MHFAYTHSIDASLAAVEAVVLDPRGVERMADLLDGIAAGTLLHVREGPGWVERVAWFRPRTILPAILRVLAPHMLEWEETTRWQTADHQATFVIRPALPPFWQHRFSLHGTYTLLPEGAGVRRTVEGDLRIDAPFVSATLERAVIAVIGRQFEQEAEVVARAARAP